MIKYTNKGYKMSRYHFLVMLKCIQENLDLNDKDQVTGCLGGLYGYVDPQLLEDFSFDSYLSELKENEKKMYGNKEATKEALVNNKFTLKDLDKVQPVFKEAKSITFKPNKGW